MKGYGLRSGALADAVESFRRHRRALGYAATYVAGQAHAAAEALRFFERERGARALAEVTAADVEAYYRHVARRVNYRRPASGPLHASTRAGLIAAAGELYGVALAAGWVDEDPTSGVAGAPYVAGGYREERRGLTRGEVAGLYAVARGECADGDGADDEAEADPLSLAVLGLCYGCGLRVAEACAVDLADVDLRGARVVVRSGKGGRRRVVPMAAGVARDLGAYLAECRGGLLGGGGTAAVLVNARGRRMRGPTVNRHLARLSAAAGIAPACTAHVLRHSIATHLLAGGMSVDLVRVFLGHAHLETTQVYTHVDAAMLEGLVL